MVDNLTITPGLGADVATDDISSVHYPRHKLIHGADGTNDGDVSTQNGLPVRGSALTTMTAVSELSAATLNSSYSSFANLNITGLTGCSVLSVWNDLDVPVELSFDEGSTRHGIVPPHWCGTVSILAGTTSVYAKRYAAASAGTFFYGASK